MHDSPRLVQQLRKSAQKPANTMDAGTSTTHGDCGVCAMDSGILGPDLTRTTHGSGRKPHTAHVRLDRVETSDKLPTRPVRTSDTGVARRTAITVAAVSVAALSVAQPATAKTYEDRIRTAPVTYAYSSALNAYTGGSYGVETVNQLWPRFPRHQRSQRAAMIAAGRKYGVPLRLLMGVYGMESGFGRFRCYFGLTGYFPGSGTSGSFNRDAMLSAGIFRRLLGRHMVR